MYKIHSKLKKIKFDWNERNIKKLIRCVHMRKILWHPKHANNQNRLFCDLEWRLIGNEIFDDNVRDVDNEVRKKWESLCLQYDDYNKNYNSNGNDKKNIMCKYFELMKFLPVSPLPPIQQQETKEDSADSVSTKYTSLTVNKSQTKSQFKEEVFHSTYDDDNISTENNELSNQLFKKLQKASFQKPSFQKANFNTTSKKESPGAIKLKASNLITDQFTDFGKFVANELRNLKYAFDLQSRLKRQIQRYMIDIADEYALRCLSQSSDESNDPKLEIFSTPSSVSASLSGSKIESFSYPEKIHKVIC